MSFHHKILGLERSYLYFFAITLIRIVINNKITCHYILIAVKCLQNGLSVEVIDLNL